MVVKRKDDGYDRPKNCLISGVDIQSIVILPPIVASLANSWKEVDDIFIDVS